MDEASRVEPTAKQPEKVMEPDEDGMAKAVSSLRLGQLVAFPTETVYGLGADARNERAVASVFEAKGRPAENPLIVHVKNLEMACRYGCFDPLSLKLAEHFWPGPLTLVVPLRNDAGLSELVTAGLGTVALRVPASDIALALLNAFDAPVAAPSANPSGKLSPTEAEHVEEELGEHLALILDGGACQFGLESTIVTVRDDSLALLRVGAISMESLVDLLGEHEVPLPPAAPMDRKPDSPGQFTSHYAPNARLRLNATNLCEGEMMLAFGPDAPKKIIGVNLSPGGDLLEAATNLYAYLRILDDTGVKSIAVMSIPNEGLGRAINDRLQRAAAPRPEE